MSARVPGIGAALAATGLAHFAKPQAFESITKAAFPNNTRRYTYVNGGIETALGVAMVVPQTRKFAFAGVAGYLVYLVVNAVRARR
ncbi:MAG: hypothetical protein ACR2JM_00750 [Mycobacterium sp.]